MSNLRTDYIPLSDGTTIKAIYHSNGALKSAEPLNANNKLDGLAVYFDSDGFPLEKINYENNIKNGPFKKYHEGTRQLKSEGHHKNGLPFNTVTTWYLNGFPEEINSFDNNGIICWRAGQYENYFDNGKLCEKGHFEKDLRCKDWETYYKNNGALKRKSTYVDGIEQGEYTEYYPSDKVKKQGVLKNGKPTDIEIRYDKNGKFARYIYTKDGHCIAENELKTLYEQMIESGSDIVNPHAAINNDPVNGPTVK